MRSYIDENDKKNEIRLLLNHPLYTGKIIIVVEGKSDIRLFRSVLDSSKINIETLDGKLQLIKVMESLLEEYPNRLFAICDADFIHLKGEEENYEGKSIYLTDYHDTELMMLKSPALTAFIDEYSSDGNIHLLHKELLSMALDAAYIIGLLRWINDERDLGIRFEGLNFNRFIDIEEMQVVADEDELIQDLLDRSTDIDAAIDREYMKNALAECRDRNACELQVCSGHDVTRIISMIYRARWASVELNMDKKKVESSLRLGYQIEHFKKSRLFDRLSQRIGSLFDVAIC